MSQSVGQSCDIYIMPHPNVPKTLLSNNTVTKIQLKSLESAKLTNPSNLESIQKCRQLVLRGVEKQSGDALIFGLRSGHHIPLVDIAKKYNRLVIVEQNLEILKEAFVGFPIEYISKLKFFVMDPSGFFKEVSDKAEEIAKNSTKNEFWEKIDTLFPSLTRHELALPEKRFSLVVSSFVSSDLAKLFNEYFSDLHQATYGEKETCSSDAYQAFINKVHSLHLSDLNRYAALDGTVCYTNEMYVNGNEHVRQETVAASVNDLFEEVQKDEWNCESDCSSHNVSLELTPKPIYPSPALPILVSSNYRTMTDLVKAVLYDANVMVYSQSFDVDFAPYHRKVELSIMNAAKDLKGTVLVLDASGNGLPIVSLVEQFDKVVLCFQDLGFIGRVIENIPEGLRHKLEIRIGDFTGYFGKAAQIAEDLSLQIDSKKEFTSQLVKELISLEREPFDFPEKGANFVVSSSVGYKASISFLLYLQQLVKICYPNESDKLPEDFLQFLAIVERLHTQDLRKWSKEAVFYSNLFAQDLTENRVNEDGVVVSKRKLLETYGEMGQSAAEHLGKEFKIIKRENMVSSKTIVEQKEGFQLHLTKSNKLAVYHLKSR